MRVEWDGMNEHRQDASRQDSECNWYQWTAEEYLTRVDDE